MRKGISHFATALACGVSFMAVASLGGCEQSNRQQQTFVVDSKESRLVGTGSGDTAGFKSVFYVYGTKGEVYRNEDVFWNFAGPSKFDSATLQAKFKPGHVYAVETIGWRIPFLSMTPNIVSAKDITVVKPRFAAGAVQKQLVDDPATDKLCTEYRAMKARTGQTIPAMNDLCVA